MAEKNSDGYWIDAGGNAIPPKYIKEIDKNRDALVTKIFLRAKKHNRDLVAFRTQLDELLSAYLKELAANVNIPENWKGNITLTGFSGTLQVEIDIKDYIVFDERLNIAKSLIDKYLIKKCDESGSDALRSIIHEAFNMDKKGKINRYMLRRLMRTNIKDPDWMQAMEMIRDAEQAVSSKQYIMFRYRASPQAEWQTLSLNFASL
jgi:hypothetical protein